jgi:hypothetical protein
MLSFSLLSRELIERSFPTGFGSRWLQIMVLVTNFQFLTIALYIRAPTGAKAFPLFSVENGSDVGKGICQVGLPKDVA